MNEPQTWTSVILPALSLAAVIVLGLLNLRRAKRGPSGSPRWELVQVNRDRYDLIQTGTATAKDVKIEVTGAPQVRGDSEFATFSVGQRASLIIATTFGGDEAAVTVTWAGRRDKRESWTTDL